MIKFSENFEAKRKRIQRLPRIVEDAMWSNAKKHATELIEEFKKGIKSNNLGLKKLQQVSITSKKKLGYDKPTTPLYGAGDRTGKSYINMLRIRKIKNGYKVYPSWARHHKSNLKLRDLFIVHEYGCTITMANGVIVRIPPRPALFKAYQRMSGKMKRSGQETSKEVKKAMAQFVKDGNNDLFKKITARDTAGHEDYEKND